MATKKEASKASGKAFAKALGGAKKKTATKKVADKKKKSK